jgi:hypothetical protein
MGYIFELEEELMMLLPGLLSGIPSGLFGIAAYVLTSLAIYTISSRRGLKNPWLAWIPVVNAWLLGSLSDQYQYVVKGENKNKRKWLIALNILNAALVLAMVILCLVTVGTLIVNQNAEVIGSVIALIGLILPLVASAITLCVIRYMALYDVYRSLDPDNAVLFLVLSILFSPTEPFFLFFNREKDLGMPPRKQKPVFEQPVYTQDNDYVTADDPEYL